MYGTSGFVLSELSQARKTNTVWYLLYITTKMELKKREQNGGYQDLEKGEDRRDVATSRYIRPEDLVYSTMIMDNKTIL